MDTPKVLVVDDDPFFLKLLLRQLESLGVVGAGGCTGAADGLAALADEAGGATLLFLDLNMPDMDGIEFLRQLGGIGYTGALVLVSGEDERVLDTTVRLARAHRLNVAGHLAKPVELPRLRALLDLALAAAVPKAPRPARPRGSYDAARVARAIDDGELRNVYQPKVDVASGALRGVETLVRWQHPDDGLVFPDQFIPVAEAGGLMDALTRRVLDEALAQCRRWRGQGLAVQVAVNVSMDNLTQVDFADRVLAAIERHGASAADLVLEVTESRLMADERAALDNLARLRLRRVSLSIDDFGTGHSSLAQLRDLPFDELKIDRGFVNGACRDHTRRAIFRASLDVARELGMKTVAEGVEDAADWEFLRQQGCDLAQGYHIARPMPADELVAWLDRWQRR